MSASLRQTLIVIAASLLVVGTVVWAGGQGGARAFGVPVIALAAAFSFVVNWIAFVPAWIARTEHYYDLVGSLTYLTTIVGTVALVDPSPRGWLVAGLVAVWALRLGTFLFVRVKKVGKDGRFDEVKQDFGKFLVAWTVQAAWVFLTLCAALLALTTGSDTGLGAWAIVGGAVWLLGFGIEVTADLQKSRFKQDPANEGRFIRSGLWAWSRHPNYFGEIVLWTGIYLIALPTLDGWRHIALISPIFVYVLLTRISGIPPLRKRAEEKWGDAPEYRAYVASTSQLVPLPPTRGPAPQKT